MTYKNTTSGDQPEEKARVASSRLKASGKTTRGKAHLSASTRRSQAKRDSKGK